VSFLPVQDLSFWAGLCT